MKKFVGLLIVMLCLTLSAGTFVVLGESAQLKRLEAKLNAEEYQEVRVLSISAPLRENNNVRFDINFDRAISNRKMPNMQFREKAHFKFLGSTSGGSLFSMTETELDLYDKFGLICMQNENSIINGMEFGSEEQKALKNPVLNNAIVPSSTVDGVEVYSIREIQESVDYSAAENPQPLVVQLHYEGSKMIFYLKGDFTNQTVPNYNQYNIAPTHFNQKFVIKFNAGVLFPTGVMVQEDTAFIFDNERSIWNNMNDGQAEQSKDDTLINQGGYTDDEIIGMKRQK